MEKEILEGNKLIALFMGAKKTGSATGIKEGGVANEYEVKISERITAIFYDKEGAWTDFKEMKFHESWDWLMPVVQRIGKKTIRKEWLNSEWDLKIHYSINTIGTWFEIGDHDLHITDSGIEAKEWLNISKDPITRTWLAVIEFIKWYNQNKK